MMQNNSHSTGTNLRDAKISIKTRITRVHVKPSVIEIVWRDSGVWTFRAPSGHVGICVRVRKIVRLRTRQTSWLYVITQWHITAQVKQSDIVRPCSRIKARMLLMF